MNAGLFRLGHDFGNGDADGHYFQRDALAPCYRSEKERILSGRPGRIQALEDEDARTFELEALNWMKARLQSEHGLVVPPNERSEASAIMEGFRQLSLEVQEDFALLQRPPNGTERLILFSICFPSGWRPEPLLGEGFDRIHAPVPEFGNLAAKSAQLIHAMIHRGPYVRFVWSLTADPRLDHHPDDAPRDPWTEKSEAYLRVERQLTVPFSHLGGSLFLIRTYVYALAELSTHEREVLHAAVESLPDSIKRYKGFGKETQAALARAAGRTTTS